ncbi:putative chloramphenical resistance permease RarD [Pannonibacter phragmitetus]|uniref:Putative chloramphenical resistance permease RarD n=1 Tax=Pannonibacter phragmitetus TaxID=121719 RepID=A0A378ZWQ7_9HYPH|nr:EamA family transporter RarD [Pannonibacter phragmitetus]SUB01498.1 putative chloramphenical resistance permease RarD [Pannonibacter phragmitetus]
MAMDTPPVPQQTGDTPKGFAYALTAYGLWGLLPIYLKALGHISPFEVLAHRVVWSVPCAALILLATRRIGDLKAAVRSPRTMGMAALTASLITINWCTYVYAVGSGQAIEGALGYFINPLFSILLGAIVLKEKLTRTQIAAIVLVAVAVGILTWDAGRLPWISLTLTVSWGFYAFLRKTLPVGPNQGFFLEVALLSIPAVPFILWLESSGTGHFTHGTRLDTWLLASAGVATAIPLMIYANAAKMLRLSTIAVMQYITPTIIFLIAVFVFREPMNPVKLSAFVLIWSALALYSYSMLRAYRAR